MARNKDRFRPANDFSAGGGFFNRLNRRLFPIIGPPPLGPYGADDIPPPDRQTSPCPLCNRPMSEHTFDRRGSGPTKLYCPE